MEHSPRKLISAATMLLKYPAIDLNFIENLVNEGHLVPYNVNGMYFQKYDWFEFSKSSNYCHQTEIGFELEAVTLLEEIFPDMQKNTSNSVKDKLSVANARIAELEAELILKCDSCNSRNAVKNWKKDLECAVKLAAELLAEPKQQSTEWHRGAWENLRGETRDDAFRVFRKALPAHLKYDDPNKK